MNPGDVHKGVSGPGTATLRRAVKAMANITGTTAGDALSGTTGNDSIVGLSGNDTILGLGAVPLPTLERVLDQWIAAGGPEPAATKAALAKGD